MGIILRHEQLLHGGSYAEEWYDLGAELCVRVKEDQDRDFIARLKADSENCIAWAMCLSRMCVLLPISVVTFSSHIRMPGTATFSEWVSCC